MSTLADPDEPESMEIVNNQDDNGAGADVQIVVEESNNNLTRR